MSLSDNEVIMVPLLIPDLGGMEQTREAVVE